jgi:phosphatidylglycerol:prolipoprotein diacylglycerol transferase
MMPLLVEIGPLEIRSFSVALIMALVACFVVVRWALGRFGMNRDEAAWLVIVAAIGGVIGARAAYVVAHWETFATSPLDAIRLDQGGLVFYGGAIGGFVATWLYSSARKLDKPAVADAAAVALPLGAAIGRIGCFLNGCCSGKATLVPWGVEFPGSAGAVHPTQLYDAAYNVLLFGIMVALLARRALAQGASLWAMLAGYGAFRFAVETLREQWFEFMGLSGAQIISLVLVPASLIALVLALRHERAKEQIAL